jgi:hypothetical protein
MNLRSNEVSLGRLKLNDPKVTLKFTGNHSSLIYVKEWRLWLH